jgi:glycerophosphoryl diester phosphodiesterase
LIVIAHRGASAERPENTLAAFARAIEAGADMIELDLRISTDGVVHVAHDPAATTAPGWLVRNRLTKAALGRASLPRTMLPWAAIRELAGVDERYPRLEDMLDLCGGKIRLNLELKEPRTAEPVVRELARRGLRDGILMSSFDRGPMRQVRAIAPQLDRALLCTRPPVRLRAALRSLGARALHLREAAVTARVVHHAHAAGVPVFAWTVDAPSELKRLTAIGVDGVFTNDPAGVRRLFPR